MYYTVTKDHIATYTILFLSLKQLIVSGITV